MNLLSVVGKLFTRSCLPSSELSVLKNSRVAFNVSLARQA